MNINLKFYIFYAIVYGLILLIGEGSYRFMRVKPEWSRNFSHLAAGLVSLPYPWLFSSHWWVLLLAVQSSLVLFVTRNLNLFPSHHLAGPRSAGSYLFFASMYLCYLGSSYLKNPFYFILPILILSVSDVIAAIVGRIFGDPSRGLFGITTKENKTSAGSIGFFLSSMMIVVLAYTLYWQADLYDAFVMALLISVATTLTEACSTRGFDNIFIPAIALLVMYLGASI
jgi:dolichol kinase